MKPIIGITCNYDTMDTVGTCSGMGSSGQDWNFLAGEYVYAVEKSGGIPVILPRLQDMSALEPFLSQIDGLLVTGGHDVDPHSYGEQISGKCGRVVPKRDEMDLAVVRCAYKHKKAILAICRGAQILAAAVGGKLYQDLETEKGVMHDFMDTCPGDYVAHNSVIEEDSLLFRILQEKVVGVNSLHHQAIRSIGENTKVAALSEDGIIEAIEVFGGNPFTIGVQWHPEMMMGAKAGSGIFDAFVKACEKTGNA